MTLEKIAARKRVAFRALLIAAPIGVLLPLVLPSASAPPAPGLSSASSVVTATRQSGYGAATVKVTVAVVVPASKNWGLTAKIAGTVRPFVLLKGTAFMMRSPESTEALVEK